MKYRYLVLILVLSASVLNADEKPKEEDSQKKEEKVAQTVCPVMGGKINKKVYYDHDGKRIYMCCPGCEKALKKNPEKYIKQLEDAGVVLDEVPGKKGVAQTVCPVMGGKINKKVYYDHDGKRIYMCCPGCSAALKKDPEKYIKKLEDAGVALDKVPEKKADSKKK